jgi:hypothetical protein
MAQVKTATSQVETTGSLLLSRGAKLAGETVLPGASLLLDGQVVSGGLHLVTGLLAKAVLGPLGLILVAADSYSRSVTGKGLVSLVQGEGNQSPAAQ